MGIPVSTVFFFVQHSGLARTKSTLAHPSRPCISNLYTFTSFELRSIHYLSQSKIKMQFKTTSLVAALSALCLQGANACLGPNDAKVLANNFGLLVSNYSKPEFNSHAD